MAFKGWIYFYQEVDKKMHSQKILLDTATAKWVYKLLNEHSIFQLPAAKDMATWSECFDTNYFEMEQSTPFHYSKKGYGQPCRNNYNKDEGVFMSVVTSLRQNPKIAFLLKQFLDSLPEGYYMTGGGLYALQKQRYLKSLGF
ncbi:MAG TPA: hypothetical protein PL009_05025 [Flavipsychrobacter sp.]|nr:hypothetical protein [Flavipsychrobacter sp.]